MTNKQCLIFTCSLVATTMGKFKDLTGQKFGKLIVIRYLLKAGNNDR